MLGDFHKALSQFSDPRFRRVLWQGLGLTVALLFGLYALLWGAVQWLAPDTMTLPLLGEVAWVDTLLSWTSILLMIGLSVFLMVPVAAAFTGFFLEDVAAAVEERHYPALPPAPQIPLGEMLIDSTGFFALLVVLNLGALVFYLFAGPLIPLIFWALNGFLLGREYFQIVAMRRLGRQGAKALRQRHFLQIWIAGTLMAVPLSLPILNLFVPVLGAATFTHLFHRLHPTPGAARQG